MNQRTYLTPILFSCSLCLLSSYSQPTIKEEVNPSNEISYDVIIVPGAPYKAPKMESVLKARMLWAKYLFNRKIAKNIIFSGSSVYTPYVEGKIMRKYADAFQIPSANTFSETEAEHSTENIYYSLLIAKKKGFKKIAVATDPYQAIILNQYIRKNYPDLKVLVIQYNKINFKNTSLPEIDPCSAYVDGFVALPEREGFLQRFRGTLGRNMNAKKRENCVDF